MSIGSLGTQHIMELYQSDEGPANDPCHAVEHLLYDVVVQVLPWREGISIRKQTNLVFVQVSIFDNGIFSPLLCGREKKS